MVNRSITPKHSIVSDSTLKLLLEVLPVHVSQTAQWCEGHAVFVHGCASRLGQSSVNTVPRVKLKTCLHSDRSAH